MLSNTFIDSRFAGIQSNWDLGISVVLNAQKKSKESTDMIGSHTHPKPQNKFLTETTLSTKRRCFNKRLKLRIDGNSRPALATFLCSYLSLAEALNLICRYRVPNQKEVGQPARYTYLYTAGFCRRAIAVMEKCFLGFELFLDFFSRRVLDFFSFLGFSSCLYCFSFIFLVFSIGFPALPDFLIVFSLESLRVPHIFLAFQWFSFSFIGFPVFLWFSSRFPPTPMNPFPDR